MLRHPLRLVCKRGGYSGFGTSTFVFIPRFETLGADGIRHWLPISSRSDGMVPEHPISSG